MLCAPGQLVPVELSVSKQDNASESEKLIRGKPFSHESCSAAHSVRYQRHLPAFPEMNHPNNTCSLYLHTFPTALIT